MHLDLNEAVNQCDSERVSELLRLHPELRETIDHPLPKAPFGANALFAAVQRSDRKTIEVLLQAGANINQRTDWWAGSFGVLDECDPDLAPFLLARGARLDAHAASRLGMLDALEQMLASDASIVHARGGDGQTPLHFASTLEVAEKLLAKGADINARDVDHESTPAQYMLRVFHTRHFRHDRQDIARYLIGRGAESDLLMAAALGDIDLVQKHIQNNPDCVRMDVSEHWFPKRDPRAGGSIYIWTFGMNRIAHMVARDFDHEDVFQFLMEHTPADFKLERACELGDEETFQHWLRLHPEVPHSLSDDQKRKLPQAAQSNNAASVRLLLSAGWPVDATGDMGATALHWAAFYGNAALVREILRFHPTLAVKSVEYDATALDWALFASRNTAPRASADFPATIQLLQTADKTGFQ